MELLDVARAFNIEFNCAWKWISSAMKKCATLFGGGEPTFDLLALGVLSLLQHMMPTSVCSGVGMLQH
jgi:hypothetical protein